MTDPIDRRGLLKRAGAVTVIGSLAGCGGGGDGGDGEDGAAEEPAEDGTATEADGGEEGTPTEGEDDGTPTDGGDGGTPTEGGGGDGEAPSEVDEYLSDTGNYDGSLTSVEEDVTVTVGAEGNDGYFAFEPAAIQVPTGTTVTWEWNGQGGAHNVVEEDGEFSSGDPVESEDETFEYTFEEAGTFLYVCEPHASLGMRGAVVVE